MVKHLQQNLLKMIKKCLLSFIALSFYSYGQGKFFELGVNNTSYNYRYEKPTYDFELDSSPGIFLRVGIGEFNPKIGKLSPKLNYGLSYHQFNSIGKLYQDTFEWKTNYVGGFVQYNLPVLEDDRLYIDSAVELLTLFSGKQFSFGEIYTLGKEKEFTGLWLSPRLGVIYRVDFSDYISFGVGYNFSISLNTTNSTDESLVFNSHQLSIKFEL